MSEVVRSYLDGQVTRSARHQMTIEEAEHFTPEQRETDHRSYPAHERDARTKGVPTLGSAASSRSRRSRSNASRSRSRTTSRGSAAMDFGWDHPFAAVELAWDREQDIVYVIKAHRLREATPVVHAGAIRSWGTAAALGLAAGRPAGDAGGGGGRPCRAIHCSGPQHDLRRMRSLRTAR